MYRVIRVFFAVCLSVHSMDWYPSALISDGSPCPVCVLHAALPGTDKTTRGEELMQLYDIIIRFLRDNMHPTLVNFAT